jgi:hypothetical protein
MMASTLMQIGVFALIAGLMFKFPHVGMAVHPDAKDPHRKRAWTRFFRHRFRMTAQSFLAAGAGLLTLGLFTLY